MCSVRVKEDSAQGSQLELGMVRAESQNAEPEPMFGAIMQELWILTTPNNTHPQLCSVTSGSLSTITNSSTLIVRSDYSASVKYISDFIKRCFYSTDNSL